MSQGPPFAANREETSKFTVAYPVLAAEAPAASGNDDDDYREHALCSRYDREVTYMSNQRLWAVGNATGVDAKLTSTNGDTATISHGVITKTGGSDGDYIQIPDCSGSDWYAGHHILIGAQDGSWVVSVWSNDQQNGKLYWSPKDAYFEGDPLPGSDTNWNGTLLIQMIGSNVSVGWAGF